MTLHTSLITLYRKNPFRGQVIIMVAAVVLFTGFIWTVPVYRQRAIDSMKLQRSMPTIEYPADTIAASRKAHETFYALASVIVGLLMAYLVSRDGDTRARKILSAIGAFVLVGSLVWVTFHAF